MLELHNVSRRVGPLTLLADVTLRLERGSFNVILGADGSGKTGILRIMAGLDKPSGGSVWFDGAEVTGFHVRRRNVAMVYRTGVNYPRLSVRENLAMSLRPLALRRNEAEGQMAEAAQRLDLTTVMEMRAGDLPLDLKQRLQIARAIARRADVVLLDEPMADLDAKARERLRAELPGLMADTQAVTVLATSDPTEALMLGGDVATLHEGRITQFGPAAEVYRAPRNLTTAHVFSDPPLNVLLAHGRNGKGWPNEEHAPGCRLPPLSDGSWTIAFRAHHLLPGAGDPSALSFKVKVIACELAGSMTRVHVTFGSARWTMQLPGVTRFERNATIDAHVAHRNALLFSPEGRVSQPMAEAA